MHWGVGCPLKYDGWATVVWAWKRDSNVPILNRGVVLSIGFVVVTVLVHINAIDVRME